MMRWVRAALLVSVCLLAGPGLAKAQSVRVTSGEHDGFSRIVLQFAGPVDWHVMRTEAGYTLSIPESRPRYDLTDVFRLIPRDRLSAIFADPQTGVLTLNIGCACHALPFELRPGVVVIDIRDGPPPPGSSFEQTATGQIAPPFVTTAVRRPSPRPSNAQPANAQPANPAAARDMAAALDWRADLIEAARLGSSPDMPLVEDHSLGTAREALIRQLGTGAAEGVVEFSDQLRPAIAAVRGAAADLDRHLEIGKEPGLDVEAGRRVPGMLTPDGGACYTDEALDFAAWGGDMDVAAAIADYRSAILGEFDQADETATTAAIRYFLHLGFGAEAAELIRNFMPATPDKAMWLALSQILDGEEVDHVPFEGMFVCDSAAALWAVLAAGTEPLPRGVDTAAVLRSFSALPVHLRRLVGPDLAGLFSASGDSAGASAVRDAILRAPGEPGADVQLMDAELQLANDGSLEAQPLFEPLIAGSGPAAIEATTRLIVAQVADGLTVDETLITTAKAFLHEARGSPRAGPITEALALGLASQARLDEALSLAGLSDESRQKAWDLFAKKADDNVFLSTVVGVDRKDLDAIATSTRLAVAERLSAIGLFSPALAWLEGQTEPSFRLSSARARAGLRDWRGVLQDIAGLEGEDVMNLRADALAALADPAALSLVSQLDAPEARRATARRLGIWEELLEAPPSDPWAAAARLIEAPPSAPSSGDAAGQDARPVTPPEGAAQNGPDADTRPRQESGQPLQSARQRIAESRAARDSIEALLAVLQDDQGG